MTGQLLAASGSAPSPSISFASGTTTGFFLAGTNQIGWASAGSLAATFNNDLSVTWQGAASWNGAVTYNAAATFNSSASHVGALTLGGGVTLNSTSYTFGAGAAAAWWLGIGSKTDFTIVIDGGGTALLTGQKGQLHVPFPGTVSKWWAMADQSGSIVVDILRANNGVPSSSIVGAGNAPTLSASQFNSAAPSGWTSTSLVADDFLAFNVTSATTVQRVTIALTVTRTG